MGHDPTLPFVPLAGGHSVERKRETKEKNIANIYRPLDARYFPDVNLIIATILQEKISPFSK